VSKPADYRGKKCHGKCCSQNGEVDLESCVDGTQDECSLKQGESGEQLTSIKNHKRHALDADVKFSSQNGGIKFSTGTSNSDSEFEETVTVGPSTLGSPGTTSMKLNVEQAQPSVIVEETIEVGLEITDPDSVRGKRQGPKVYPRIALD